MSFIGENAHIRILISKTCFFCAYFGLLFGVYVKNPYLCIVNEKRRNLRPAQPTKISLRAGKCFLGRAKNGV